jgi:hypothetical protein
MITITCVGAQKSMAVFRKYFFDSLKVMNEVINVLKYLYKTTG